MKIPTLTEVRKFVLKEHLNGDWDYWGKGDRSLESFFQGNCHYASKAISLMLTGHTSVVRGWYIDTGALGSDNSWIRNRYDHIAHSWVELEGRIIDPTWWAFYPGEKRVKVYTFPLDDRRYHTIGL